MNQFVNIPVLAANGAGAPVDVSKMGATKTIVVGGLSGNGTAVTIEYSEDPAGAGPWAPVPNGTFQVPGRVTLDFAARWLRAVTSDYKGGAPNADCGASGDGSEFVQVGAGSTNISALPALKTVVTAGAGILEVSQDGVAWSQAFAFSQAGGQTQRVYGQFARWTGAGTVWVGGANEGEQSGVQPFNPVTYTIYARTTGSDISGNGTLANPYATMQRAVLDVPQIVPPGAKYIVDITGITEALPQDYTLPAWSVPDSVGQPVFSPANPYIFALMGVTIYAEPQLMAAIPPADAVINLADVLSNVQDPVTQLRTITLVAPRASWGVSGLKGKFIVDAANNARNGVIWENDTVSFSLTQYETLTFPLKIMEPSATLTAAVAPLRRAILSAINIGSLGLVGLRIATPGQQGLYADSPGWFSMALCEISGLGGRAAFGTILPFRSDLNHCNWIKGACNLSSYRSVFFRACFFDACVGVDFRGLTFQDTKGIFLTRCVFDGCAALMPVNHVFASVPDGTAAAIPWWWLDHGVVRNCTDPDGAIFFSGVYGYFFRDDVYGNAGSGIVCSDGAGVLHLDNVRTYGKGVGAPNGLLGVEVRHGMRVLATIATYNAWAALPGSQLRGAGGDMKVGFFPTRTWQDFDTAPPPSGHPLHNEFDITAAAATGATGSGSQLIGEPFVP